MSETRVLLRGVVFGVSVLMLAACAQRAAISPARAGGGGGLCGDGRGNADRQAPIVCVDDLGATLSVSPDPIVLHDQKKGGSQPVVMQWFTRSGRGDLQIAIEDGCVTEVKCNGKGHCTAKSRDIDADVRCKYDVWTATHPRLDPDLVVTPCC